MVVVANRRKIRPSTGVEYSDAFKSESTRSRSAACQRLSSSCLSWSAVMYWEMTDRQIYMYLQIDNNVFCPCPALFTQRFKHQVVDRYVLFCWGRIPLYWFYQAIIWSCTKPQMCVLMSCFQRVKSILIISHKPLFISYITFGYFHKINGSSIFGRVNYTPF